MAGICFDYPAWISRYPEFRDTVDEGLGALLFDEATLYLDPSDASAVCDCAQRRMLLYMLVAHLAALSNRAADSGGTGGMTGAITSVSEGSVSISASGGVPGGKSGAWFNQTPYGASFWQAIKPWRSAFYIPPIPDYRKRIWP